MRTRFTRWNMRSLCRSGLLKAVLRELAKNRLHLLVVQEGEWGRGGTERAEYYTDFCGKGKSSISVHKRTISAVRGVQLLVTGRHI
jgi:hypothetical protein